MSRFEFETAVRGAVALVTLRGELDLHATADLEPELERLECESASTSSRSTCARSTSSTPQACARS